MIQGEKAYFNIGTVKAILYFLFSTLIICGPALFNGFPLVFSDSGMYMASSFDLMPRVSRPIGYSIFIRCFSFQRSIWPVMYAQCLIMNFLIFKAITLIVQTKLKYFVHFSIIILLVLLSSLGWYSCQIMPDIFTSGIILIIFIFISDKKLNILSSIVYLFLLVIFIISHYSNIPLTILILLSLFIMILLKPDIFIKLKTAYLRLLFLTFSVGISMLFLMSFNYYHGKGFRMSTTSNVFTSARFAENGILKKYLNDNCGKINNELCNYKDSIPDNVNDFLWSDKALLTKMGYDFSKWESADSILSPIIHNILSSPKYLKFLFWEGIKGTLQQLFKNDIGQGLVAFREKSAPYKEIKYKFSEDETNEFLNSLQNRGLLKFNNINLLNYVVLSFSIMIIFFGWYYEYLNRYAIILTITSMLGIVYNAAIISTLSNIGDRKQARLSWLVVLLALIILYQVVIQIRKVISKKPHTFQS